MKEENKKISFYFVMILVSAFIYAPMFGAPFIIDVDNFLIDELKSISSISEYISAWGKYQIHDLQPVRDASLIIDRELSKAFGISTYLYTNFLLWLIIVYLIIHVSFKYSKLSYINTCLVLGMYLCHPIFIKSVSQVGVRKHLLAFIFILMFFKEFLKKPESVKTNSKACLYFLLSLLSQPINIFIPVWALYHLRFVKKLDLRKIAIRLSPYFIMSLIIGVINLWWYQEIDQAAIGVAKYSSENMFGDKILAVGRYFSFFLIPINFSGFYGKESILCVLGIFIGPLYMFFSYKSLKKVHFVSLLVLFFCAILPVTINLFLTFVSETYFLFGSLTLFCILILIIQKIKNEKIVSFGLILMLGLNLYQSTRLLRVNINKDQYFQIAYNNDQNCINLNYLVQDLFYQEKVKEAVHYGTLLINRKCSWYNKETHQDFSLMIAKILVYSNGQFEARERKLIKLAQVNYHLKLALALFYIRENRASIVEPILKEGIEHKVTFPTKSIVMKDIIKFCQTTSKHGCEATNRYLKLK